MSHVQTSLLCLSVVFSVVNPAAAQQQPGDRWDKELNGPWYVTEFFYGYPRDVLATVYCFRSGVMCSAYLEGDSIVIDDCQVTVSKRDGSANHITLKPYRDDPDDDSDKVYYGIYKIEGDRLTLAYAEKRPESFEKKRDESLTTSSANPRIFELRRGDRPSPLLQHEKPAKENK